MSTARADALVAALVDALDDHALEVLAERLAPRLEARFAQSPNSGAGADRWMTTAEAAAYLGVTPNALHKLTAARALPFAQDGPGCRCYFKRSDLDRWRDSRARGARARPSLVADPHASTLLPRWKSTCAQAYFTAYGCGTSKRSPGAPSPRMPFSGRVRPLCHTCCLVMEAASLAKTAFDPTAPDDWPETLSPEEFKALFPGETEVVEFKEGLSVLQDSIVAFSNTRGGLILIGVRNDGTLKGVSYGPPLEDKIWATVEQTHSPGPVAIRRLSVGKHSLAVVGVGVLTEGFAQTSQGRVLTRVGTRRPALIGSALVRFMHERATSSFERHATDVPFTVASDELGNEVLDRLGIRRSASATSRLRERGLIGNAAGRDVLTVAGCLYLLDRPDRALGKAYVEVMRFPAGSSDPDRRLEFTGPLHRQVEQVLEFVMGELGHDSVVLGLRRHDLPRLPERVVREAVANAVAHRSYELRGTPVRIEMHPDRVEITSPGGLPAGVTVETMRDTYMARNNAVIAVLRRFNLAEDSGKGVDLIQDLMRDELLEPPTFLDSDMSVTVRLPVLSGTRPEERAWVREVVDRGAIEDKDRVLLVHARRGEVLSNQRARELLKTGRDGAMAALRRLVDAGLLVRSGQRAGTRYYLAESLTPPAGLRLSRAELRRIVLEMAEERPVTNQQVRQRTGLDRTDVLALFEDLVERGELVRLGERRATRYVRAEDA